MDNYEKILQSFKQNAPDMKDENPDLTGGEVIKKLSQDWNEMPEKQKAKYNKKAEKDKKRFLEQQAEFKKNGFYTQTKNSTLSSKKTQKTQSQKKRSQKKSTSPKKSSAKK